jgi:hypothetical protein
VFLPPGQPEQAALFTYVQHSLLSTVLVPAPFIWAAIRAVMSRLCFDVLPFSHGSLLLRF